MSTTTELNRAEARIAAALALHVPDGWPDPPGPFCKGCQVRTPKGTTVTRSWPCPTALALGVEETG